MSDDDEEEPNEVHNHYHLWPKDCGCAAMVIAFFFFCMIEALARLDKLPW